MVGTKAGSCNFPVFVFAVVTRLLITGVVQTDSSCLGYRTNAMQAHTILVDRFVIVSACGVGCSVDHVMCVWCCRCNVL